jgi:GT2 family glycosyltransferase
MTSVFQYWLMQSEDPRLPISPYLDTVCTCLDRLATEIRDRLGAPPELTEYPLVSIVVPNRDGAPLLRRLLTGLLERTEYPHLELIVVDNGSRDDSLELLRSVEAPFPISVLANAHNESFSDACNQGAEVAEGDLLLFLNNDVEPFEPGWLGELVGCLLGTGAGAVGATLISPPQRGDLAADSAVQTRKVRLRQSSGWLVADDEDPSRRLFDEGFGEDVEAAFPIGPCILLTAELFRRVGGFTHGYFYGGEDTDLFFKVRTEGAGVLYSGRSVLVHRMGSTRRDLISESNGALNRANYLMLVERWGPRVWREYQLDRLAGRQLWAAPDGEAEADTLSREQVLALGFCIRADAPAAEADGPIAALEAGLGRRRHRCLVLRGESVGVARGFLYDVAVHLRGPARYIPKPGQLNVLWAVGHLDAVSRAECRSYDLVVTADAEGAGRLRADGQPTPVAALDDDRQADDLIDAALARVAQIDFPTRIEGRA